jgi:signal transduction histidine kinase
VTKTVKLTPQQMITVLRALIVALVLFSPCIWAQSSAISSPVVVGGDHSYPPYEFLDKDGKPTGYNVELTLAIAEVMGMEVDIVLGEWGQMRDALKSGKIDALQGMAYSDQRSQYFDFSPAHAIIHQSIFAHRGGPVVERLADLRGKEVIVQRGGIMHDNLLQQKVGAVIVLADTHTDALRLLASGKHDYALVANLPGLYLGKELGLSNIVPVAKPLKGQRYGYAVKKDNDELLTQFSEGLAILNNTGRQQALYDKWLGPLEVGRFPWKKIGMVGAVVSAILLLVLGGIVIWNRQLQRKVEQRTQALRTQQQQLIQADKMTSLGILVSGVAHEINNPAGLLLLNLPVLIEASEDARDILDQHFSEHGDFMFGGLAYSRMREEITPMLQEMLQGTQGIKRIVDDLKDFARQGNVDLTERVDLNNVVATAIRLVDNAIRKATDHFEVHYADALPELRGNAQRVEQVVINLILNACQALDNSDQAISLSTRYNSRDKTVELDVKDQGSGVNPEHLTRLTDPFFTTKREMGGTGLGLSVSAGIVQEHGGRLHFDSTPGQGTTVTLSIPKAKERHC